MTGPDHFVECDREHEQPMDRSRRGIQMQSGHRRISRGAKHAIGLSPHADGVQKAPEHRLERGEAARGGIVQNHQPVADATQLLDAVTPSSRVHHDSEADGNLERAIRELQRVRITAAECHRQALAGGALARDSQHLLGGVNTRDDGSCARELQRGASGSRANVQNGRALNTPDRIHEQLAPALPR